MVISASARAGGVYEEPWEVFSAGKAVVDEGYLSMLVRSRVLQRAKRLIGTSYRLFDFNCDHLVALALGEEPRSVQLRATVAVPW